MGESRRRPGRPRLIEGQTLWLVHVRVPEELHARACSEARRAGVSVSAVMRCALERLLKDESSFTLSV